MNRKEFEAFEQFIDLLYDFSRMVQTYDSTARQYGTEDMLFMVEAHTVRMIGREPKITITEIAQKTNKTKSAVSQMIDKLSGKGVLEKIRDPDDNRRYILQLTEKGRMIFEFHEKLDQKNYQKIFDHLEGIDLSDIQAGSKVLSQIVSIPEENLEE